MLYPNGPTTPQAQGVGAALALRPRQETSPGPWLPSPLGLGRHLPRLPSESGPQARGSLPVRSPWPLTGRTAALELPQDPRGPRDPSRRFPPHSKPRPREERHHSAPPAAPARSAPTSQTNRSAGAGGMGRKYPAQSQSTSDKGRGSVREEALFPLQTAEIKESEGLAGFGCRAAAPIGCVACGAGREMR